MFDWSDVRVFLAVHRGGSFTAAAQELRMDQTTIGRRIAALETVLGAKLFHRRRDGLTPTTAAQSVLEHAARMEENALALDRSAHGLDAAVAGVVRVTTLESFAAVFLAPRLGRLRAKHPALSLDLHIDNRSLNLTRRESDLAVRYGKPTQMGLVARKIGSVGYALYGAPSYLKARGGKAAVRDLAKQDLLGFDDDLAFIPEAAWLSQQGGDARVLRSNNLIVLASAAVAGLGLAVLPYFVGSGRKDLVCAVPDVATRDLWLAVHTDLRATPRVRAVSEFIAEVVREEEALLLGRANRP